MTAYFPSNSGECQSDFMLMHKRGLVVCALAELQIFDKLIEASLRSGGSDFKETATVPNTVSTDFS